VRGDGPRADDLRAAKGGELAMTIDVREARVRLAEAREAGIRCGQYAVGTDEAARLRDLAGLLATLGLDVVLRGQA
jgi:hypothetical protein